jgi:hypothetical protein
MPKAIEQGLISHDRGLFEALVPQMGQRRVVPLPMLPYYVWESNRHLPQFAKRKSPSFATPTRGRTAAGRSGTERRPANTGHRNFVTLIAAHWTSS